MDPEYPRKKRVRASFLHKLRESAPHSPKLAGFATLVISGGILLLLNGLTLTATVLGLVFFVPLIIISSPIWIPVAIASSVAGAGLLSFSGFLFAAVVGLRWAYRYFFKTGESDRVEYAGARFDDRAAGMDYGSSTRRIKDVAPGA